MRADCTCEVAEANVSALIAGLYLKLGAADEALKEGTCCIGSGNEAVHV